MTSVWTAEREAELRELWATDMMPLEISRRMGMTKNQVLGKAYRLILPPKKQRRSDAPPPPRRRVREVEEKRSMYAAPLAARTCQYPHGDPRKPGFHFCGDLVVPGKPYCAAHCAVAYTVYRTKTEAQRALERELGGALKAIEREAREMRV